LPLEYWRPWAIFSITRGIGTPLYLDDHTMKKIGFFFSRVLVDIDLLSLLPNHLLVEHSGFTFIADVEYEWLPPFCSHCKMIVQDLAQCRVFNVQGQVVGPQHQSF